MTRLERLLIGLLVLAVVVGLAGWFGYSKGKARGLQKKQAEWDEAVRVAEQTRTETRLAGWEKADKLESDLGIVQGKLDVAIRQRKAALAQKVVCPPSGQIGDVVVPAAAVRSMFNLADPGTVPASRPAASQPAPTMPSGFTGP